MDATSTRWLSELIMEEPIFMEHFEMDSLHDFSFQSFSSKNHSSFQDLDHKTIATEVAAYTVMERPMKQLKVNRWKSCTTTKQHVTPKASSSSSSHVISFGSPNSPPGAGSCLQLHANIDCCTMKPKDEAVSRGNMNCPPAVMISQGSNHELNQNYSLNSGQVTEIQRQDHVLAERMRREKLTQRFIALSSLIPGLKKADKASVLGEAAKYLKLLQERLKTLEEQTAKKVVESVVFVKKSQLSFESDHDNSSSDENFECKTNQSLPEIEARVSDKNVLIRFHCEKHKGCVVKLMSAIEKVHLTVTSTSVLPFGDYAMDITVVAEMETGYCMTLKDLVKNLRHAFPKSM